MSALNLFLLARGHAVVAQIIKTKFGVRAVGDVTLILLAANLRRLIVQNDTDRQAEKFVDGAHPFGIARGQIIVHRHDMDAAAGERVEINGHGGDERLAFAGGHFRDVAGVQRITADELNIERHHFPTNGMTAHNDILSAQTAAGIFDDRERPRQNLVQLAGEFRAVLDLGEFRLPCGGLGAQFVVGQRLQSGFNIVDLVNDRPDFFNITFVL